MPFISIRRGQMGRDMNRNALRNVIIHPDVSDEAAWQMFPNCWRMLKPYLRVVAQPQD